MYNKLLFFPHNLISSPIFFTQTYLYFDNISLLESTINHLSNSDNSNFYKFFINDNFIVNQFFEKEFVNNFTKKYISLMEIDKENNRLLSKKFNGIFTKKNYQSKIFLKEFDELKSYLFSLKLLKQTDENVFKIEKNTGRNLFIFLNYYYAQQHNYEYLPLSSSDSFLDSLYYFLFFTKKFNFDTSFNMLFNIFPVPINGVSLDQLKNIKVKYKNTFDVYRDNILSLLSKNDIPMKEVNDIIESNNDIVFEKMLKENFYHYRYCSLKIKIYNFFDDKSLLKDFWGVNFCSTNFTAALSNEFNEIKFSSN